ncbi:MAG: hypothetical protein K0U24_04755 [Gammaproteobacteria bacterium]|nr:hypothetical protein [Gammaproteobacteria bacterium]MCH9715964.1 hypothetical protein [Gammaproteobacteria bacterium]MCH9763526.1 hypothetical protein [Gammaproteobacteria bacterium]
MGILNQKITVEILSKVKELANKKHPEDSLGRPLPPATQSDFFSRHNTFFGRHTLNDRLLQSFRAFLISKAELPPQDKERMIIAFQTSLNTAKNTAFFYSIFQKNANLFLLDTAPVSMIMDRGFVP